MESKSSKRQFVRVSNEEIEEMKENVNAKTTQKATTCTVKAFRDYLSSKGVDPDFEIMNAGELDFHLGLFFVEMRNKDGELYKKTTLMSYRHSIQRFLSTVRDDINIIHGDEFKNSKTLFKAQTKKIKAAGKAKVDHHPPIEEADVRKLYDYVCSQEYASLLQKKVFIDIMIHFGRRGRENLRDLKRSDFAITTDGSGDRYVYMTDEKTKNHQDDSREAEGQMYEVKDNDRCPVKSFMRYVRRMNPICGSFFQQPREEPIEGIFFNNVPLGHNKLGQMMKLLSQSAGLSWMYTNHSLRATTVHVLDSARIPSRHIMTVTGHKSETSLKTYSGQTDLNTKKLMSRKLSEKTSAMNMPQVPSTVGSKFPIQPLTNSQELALIDDLQDDYNAYNVPEIDAALPLSQPQFVANSYNFNETMQRPVPVFNNCSNITVNCYFNPCQQ